MNQPEFEKHTRDYLCDMVNESFPTCELVPSGTVQLCPNYVENTYFGIRFFLTTALLFYLELFNLQNKFKCLLDITWAIFAIKTALIIMPCRRGCEEKNLQGTFYSYCIEPVHMVIFQGLSAHDRTHICMQELFR